MSHPPEAAQAVFALALLNRCLPFVAFLFSSSSSFAGVLPVFLLASVAVVAGVPTLSSWPLRPSFPGLCRALLVPRRDAKL